jgi:hypothetical protein
MRERRRPMRLEPRNPPSDVPHGGLRSWREVSRIWHLRSGELLTHQRLVQIAQSGIRKLRKAIENDPRLCGDLGVDELED